MKNRLKSLACIVGIAVLLVIVVGFIRDLAGMIPHTPLFEYNRHINAFSGADALLWFSSSEADVLGGRVDIEDFVLIFPFSTVIMGLLAARFGVSRIWFVAATTVSWLLIFGMRVKVGMMMSELSTVITGNEINGSYMGLVSAIIGLGLALIMIRVIYRPQSKVRADMV